jgi:NAD(P)-dependent dehydrogenase (short-subunit alcohol dehydrogenase family)
VTDAAGLQGKRALVTGSTAGIGFATAKLLAAEGASVIVNGRSQARVDQALKGIQGRAVGVAADLGSAKGCEALARAVQAVDILVNNVGIFEPKPFEEIPDEDWLRFFEVNVMSGVRLARRYLAGMRAKNWGRIVFVSTMA